MAERNLKKSFRSEFDDSAFEACQYGCCNNGLPVAVAERMSFTGYPYKKNVVSDPYIKDLNYVMLDGFENDKHDVIIIANHENKPMAYTIMGVSQPCSFDNCLTDNSFIKRMKAEDADMNTIAGFARASLVYEGKCDLQVIRDKEAIAFVNKALENVNMFFIPDMGRENNNMINRSYDAFDSEDPQASDVFDFGN